VLPPPALIDIAHALGHLPAPLAYSLLFGLVAAESAGLPVPGETSLTLASLLAARGHLTIEFVIAVAAIAAIIGDNTGYVIGRRYGRSAMLAGRWWHERRVRMLDEAETVFRSHGGKLVFFARWLPVLRFFGGPLAGIAHLPWPRFFIANATSGILWACSIGLLAYTTGQQGTTGLIVLASILGIGSFITHFAWRRLRATSTNI
jgi:undecaprenyl-diphosphatase